MSGGPPHLPIRYDCSFLHLTWPLEVFSQSHSYDGHMCTCANAPSSTHAHTQACPIISCILTTRLRPRQDYKYSCQGKYYVKVLWCGRDLTTFVFMKPRSQSWTRPRTHIPLSRRISRYGPCGLIDCKVSDRYTILSPPRKAFTTLNPADWHQKMKQMYGTRQKINKLINK